MNQSNKNIDQIVASYASIGRLQRRRKLHVAIGALAALPVLALIAYQFGGPGSTPANPPPQKAKADERIEEVREIKDLLADEIEAINSQRNLFERNRAELLNQSTELESELTEIAERRELLERQDEEIVAQQDRIARAFAEIDRKNKEIDERKAEIARTDPIVKNQRAALDEERQNLENLRIKMAEESALLEEEILAITRERTELAAQRMVVQKRREELRRLIEQSRGIDGSQPSAEPEDGSPQQDEYLGDESGRGSEPGEFEETQITADAGSTAYFSPAVYRPNSSPLGGVPYVDAVELDQMRGGYDNGHGMVISIGLTRSASVNGEEQYSNYLNLTDALAGAQLAAENGETESLVQIGEGNYVAPEVLDALAGNFSSVLQNSLDNQNIELKNVYDISIENVSEHEFNTSAYKAIHDSIHLTP